MQAHQLRPDRGAKHDRKRIGRGNAAGQGTYAGKGLKGQKARSGNDIRIGFEGGQLPMIKRMGRKRGFNNKFRIEYQPVNLARLAMFAAKAEVTPEALRAAGIVKHLRQPLKLLGTGEIDRPLTVRLHRVSAEARRRIEAAGGSVEELTAREEPKERRVRRTTAAQPAQAEVAAQAEAIAQIEPAAEQTEERPARKATARKPAKAKATSDETEESVDASGS